MGSTKTVTDRDRGRKKRKELDVEETNSGGTVFPCLVTTKELYESHGEPRPNPGRATLNLIHSLQAVKSTTTAVTRCGCHLAHPPFVLAIMSTYSVRYVDLRSS